MESGKGFRYCSFSLMGLHFDGLVNEFDWISRLKAYRGTAVK